MSRRGGWGAVALAAAIVVAGAEPARTEDEPTAHPQLEEIVVTAQRRTENVRDVPIAVSVLSGEALRDAGITRFDDMARWVPNVSFNSDFNSLYLRGIGTAELNVIGEQAVVYMLDDVYVPRLDYLKPGFMDLRQMEILKGPQGTLYGRNATGGVIKIDYGEPTAEWTGYLDLTGGERDRQEGEVALGGPITDWASIRVAARSHREDGHTSNLVDGKTLGDKEIEQFRAKLRLDPLPGLEVNAGVHRFDYFIGVWAGNETFVYPDALGPAITLLDPTFETELDRRASANEQNRSAGQGWLVPLKLGYEIWDHTLTSISAYAELDDFQGGDIDGNGAALARLLGDTESDLWSEELRVTSPPGWIEYVGGLFLYQSSLFTDVDIPLVPGALPGGGGSDEVDNVNGKFEIDVESLGVFGQATWHVLDSLALLVGGRYSRDAKHGRAVATPEGPIWEILVLGGYTVDKHVVDTDFSPKVSLLWDVMEEVTAYATYAEGFRAGSFNVAAFVPEDFEFKSETSETFEAGIKTQLLDGRLQWNLGGFLTNYHDYQLAAFNGFGYVISNAEKVRSTGLESDATALLWPGLVASGALGFNDAEFVKQTQATCPTTLLSFDGPAALPPKRTCDLSGEPLFRAPRWSGSVRLGYERALGLDLPFLGWPLHGFVGSDAAYKGAEFMDSDLDPLDVQSSYWLVGASLGLKDSEGRWQLTVRGTNLTDELVKTFSGDIPLQPGAHWALTNAPRTFSASMRFSF